jgi:hypothetical protein
MRKKWDPENEGIQNPEKGTQKRESFHGDPFHFVCPASAEHECSRVHTYIILITLIHQLSPDRPMLRIEESYIFDMYVELYVMVYYVGTRGNNRRAGSKEISARPGRAFLLPNLRTTRFSSQDSAVVGGLHFALSKLS